MEFNFGEVWSFLRSLLGTGIAVFVLITAYLITRRIFKKREAKSTKGTIIRQLVLGLLIQVGLIIILLTLPIENEIKSQIMGLIGIVLSATFALSATTFLGNALAGIMNRLTNHFEIGDIVLIEEYFGRVTKKGLFHTEIQAEDRDLITFPNMYFTSNPIKVVRSSGTVISSSVSLGYDVSRQKIERCLKEATTNSGLTDAFVYIKELGDFSVVYKVHGMLEDSGKILTATSRLNGCVLDNLHEAGIEIVSPTFMNQRQVNDTLFIPKKAKIQEVEENVFDPEDMMFDKAIKAETIEKKQEQVIKLEGYITERQKALKDLKDEAEINELKEKIAKWSEMLVKTKESIVQEKKNMDKDK